MSSSATDNLTAAAASSGSASAMTDTPPVTSWVGETLDAAGSWSVRSKAPVLIGILMLFDSLDSAVIGSVMPVLGQVWHLTPIQLGAFGSSGYAGQFVGALVFGSLAERVGRLPVIRWLVLLMCLLAIGCAVAGNYDQLIVLRTLQGVTIGGALPISVCYINEIAPTATRGRFFGTFQFLMTAGFGLASLVAYWLIPKFSWPILFALGALPLLVLPFTRILPESPRWLAARGRVEEAARSLETLGAGNLPAPTARTAIAGSGEKVPVRMLFQPAIRKTFIITALLWFLTSLVSFGLSAWIPSLYVKMFNISLVDALRYNVVVSVSIFILPIILRQSIDRIGRRPLPMLGTAVGGVALIALILIPIDARMVVVTLAIVGQIGISIGSMVLWPYTSETYPTRVRSLVLGTSSSLARAASALTPLLVGVVLQMTGSVTLIFIVFGLASFAVALLWLLGVRETAGQQMKD